MLFQMTSGCGFVTLEGKLYGQHLGGSENQTYSTMENPKCGRLGFGNTQSFIQFVRVQICDELKEIFNLKLVSIQQTEDYGLVMVWGSDIYKHTKRYKTDPSVPLHMSPWSHFSL